MSRRLLAGAAVLACALIGLGVAPGPAADRKEAPGKDVFGTTRLVAIHLEIPAKEYEAMQPPAGGFGFPGPEGRGRQRALPVRSVGGVR
jgi:hypothetical protein